MSKTTRSRYPVFITAADHPTGLITARALLGSGAQVIGFCQNKTTPACRSNRWSALHTLGDHEDLLNSNLIAVRRSFEQKPVLMPIQDDLVHWISKNRSFYEKYFLFNLPSEETVDLLLDKAEFHNWAAKNGFTVPESYILSEFNEAATRIREFGYKAIIKPYLKTEKWNRSNPADKVFKITSKEDLYKVGENIFATCPKIVVQRWIPGGDENIFFCLTYFDKNGNDLGYFTGRKLYQWPVHCGSTAVAVSEANQEIMETTREIFRRANYRGLGSIEFKKNPEDGKYFIIEPTVGRNDLQSYVSVQMGLNFTRFALDDLVGDRTQSFRPSVNTATQTLWINEETVLDSIRRRPEKTIGPLNYLLRRLFDGKVSFAYLHLKDLGPFAFLAFKKVTGILEKMIKKRRTP